MRPKKQNEQTNKIPVFSYTTYITPHRTPYEKTRISTHPYRKLQIRSQILQAVNGKRRVSIFVGHRSLCSEIKIHIFKYMYFGPI
jgi:hypothetical protein